MRDHVAELAGAIAAPPAPTDAPSTVGSTTVNRTTTSMHVYGNNVYVGFCGDCGSVANDTGFANGIATNVGGALPPMKNTADPATVL